MFWLKSCPRCRGDLYEDKDRYGWYVSCFQCGHQLREAEEMVLRCLPQAKSAVRRGQEAGKVWAPDEARVLEEVA